MSHLRDLLSVPPSQEESSRFWSKVHVLGLDDCWEWMAGRFKNGYGAFALRGCPIGAHRFSFRDVRGVVQDGLHILHHCDRPPCVNPLHLFAGTPQDNTNDMLAKGRHVAAFRTPDTERVCVWCARSTVGQRCVRECMACAQTAYRNGRNTDSSPVRKGPLRTPVHR